MQQTSKYQFNLVEGSDDFSPTPLNQNMEKVEEALGDMEDAVDGVMEAAYTPENKPFVVGSYTGNLANTKFTLGFRPSLVMIGRPCSGNDQDNALSTCNVFQGDGIANVLTFDNDGFTVIGNVYTYPHINWRGYQYIYIAFR